MPNSQPDTDQLLQQTVAGDQSAAQELVTRFRPRLRRMVDVHLDRRLSARVDPSDVVQDVLAEAFQRLPVYADERPISFYPWLRRIAWQRLIKVHRTHLKAARRSVEREVDAVVPISDNSVGQLVDMLAVSQTGPAQKLVNDELRDRVRAALEGLRPADRELLAMRYLEHLSLKEIAETTDATLAATRRRHTRALERLEQALTDT